MMLNLVIVVLVYNSDGQVLQSKFDAQCRKFGMMKSGEDCAPTPKNLINLRGKYPYFLVNPVFLY